LAGVPKISPALKKRAAQIKLLLMDVDGTMTDGSVTLLSQTDGTALRNQDVRCARRPGPDPGAYRRPAYGMHHRSRKLQHCFAAPTK
jgi:hypothetical protein